MSTFLQSKQQADLILGQSEHVKSETILSSDLIPKSRIMRKSLPR
jgi:hypothetical protein